MQEAVAVLSKYDIIIEHVNLGTFRFFHLLFLGFIWVFPKWVNILNYILETFWTLTRKLLSLKLGDIHSQSPQILGHLFAQS